MGVISLTTDFGLSDEYVGVMKGVLLSKAPTAQLVDLCHEIAPFDITGAAELIKGAFRFFPEGTVHVIVVDPGVGSAREIVCARCDGHTLLAPDNGLLPAIMKGTRPSALHRVTRSELFLSRVSSTFHGRDIFAPVAAHLHETGDLASLGPELRPESLVPTPEPPCPKVMEPGRLIVPVSRIDHFGNAITNLSQRDYVTLTRGAAPEQVTIEIATTRITGVNTCYAEVASGATLALFGSRNTLEIAVCCGNAAQMLGIARGDTVTLTWPVP